MRETATGTVRRATVRAIRLAIAVAACVCAATLPASGQAPTGSGLNQGNLHLTATIDLPSLYIFRGVAQELDPAVTVIPAVDVTATLGATRVSVGTWHSLQTGSSGRQGPTGRLHYEERFWAGVELPVGAGLSLAGTYTAYTSPNLVFESRQEVAVRLSARRWLKPYALAAVEIRGALDGIDDGAGSYFEAGLEPTLSLGVLHATLAVPTKVGISLKNYYQRFGVDHRFGFASTGGMVSIPLREGGASGAWSLHGGVEVYGLGDTPQSLNDQRKSAVVGVAGLTLRY